MSHYYWLLVLAVASLDLAQGVTRHRRSTTECPFGLQDDEQGFFVFLTVNSRVHSSFFSGASSRAIELNWTRPPGAKSTDWVGLFRGNPMFRLSEPLVKVNASLHNGYFKTAFQFPKHPMLGLASEKQMCLSGFYIGYVSDDRAVKTNCIKIQPNWMWNERANIGDVPLHALMIPGTHNSGSYETSENERLYNVVTRYSVNQAENVWNQLLYGIRYLDLRVGRLADPERFWVMHDSIKMQPLYVVLQDIRRFLQQVKNEIVILDFHRFPVGFQDASAHKELVKYLQEELHEFMAPDWLGRDVTPNDLWNLNRTLLVTYSDDSTSVSEDVLWFEVRHAWGNKRKARNLKTFLAESMYQSYSSTSLWAAMAHLTPSSLDVFFDLNGGFDKLSDKIARKITKWFRDEWWDSANLVATDFFLGNNMVEESIRANRKRKRCRDQQSWS